MLTHEYPYPHEHSRHALMAVLVTSLFFISTDNMHLVLHKLDKNIKWWSIYAFLLGFFYFFSSPFLGRTIEPSYSNFSRWYVAWLLIAALYHLPSFHSMGVDIRMNLSLFFTLFLASFLVLTLFHITFWGLWYLGLAAPPVGKRPALLTIIQNSVVLSIACCVFYSHCGNEPTQPLRFSSTLHLSDMTSQQSDEHDFAANVTSSFWGWNAQLVKEQVCQKWLAPVGSAEDYPVFSKWVLYGEVVCYEGCVGPSAHISPVYSLWATFIGLDIANYVVERSTGWALTHLSLNGAQSNTSTAPKFLDMVPWYSGTSADLFKTAFDLLVSVTLFLGRFDMRTMQAAMTQAQQHGKQDGLLYKHLSKRKELWLDFMADTGDGGNSTYSIARLLAQPFLCVTDEKCCQYHHLPRSNLLLVGGDLAYPNPSTFSYERRLFQPFQYALQPPAWYRPEHIAVQKPELPEGVDSLEHFDAPQCFAIPGNHDWFDGLDTFMRYICHRSWLGGWLLPQQKSYFALHLPHGWWVFGLDQALHGDIDIFQFKYFSDIAREEVGEHESVILLTHEPNWLLDWYWGSSTGRNVSHLIDEHLKGRCRLRLAGDLHHYMRHSVVPGTKASVEHLLVNGSGGAFLHPTHVFAGFRQFQGSCYDTLAAYPSMQDSRKIAWGNILKFRRKNWRFDVIGGLMYFILVFSMFPQCELDGVLQDVTMEGHMKAFWVTMGQAFVQMLGHSYVSVVVTLVLLMLAILFVPVKVSRRKRIVIGFLHVSAHLTAAMILMLLLEICVETCVRHNLLGNTGYHSLYQWYNSKEGQHFPDPTGLKARIEYWSFGLYPACIKYLMAAFDVPEVMAVTRSSVCKNGMNSLPRGFVLVYYCSVFLYYWILSCPVVSLVFGSYLYTCINWFHLHFDEAFSSLRIANFKSFSRCHITMGGDLQIFTLAIDKVPKEWALDPHWEAEQACQQEVASHDREFPSQWTPVGLYRERNCNVRIIDHFVIEKRPGQTVEATPSKTESDAYDSDDDSVVPQVDSGQADLLDLKAEDFMVNCSGNSKSASATGTYGQDAEIDGSLNWFIAGGGEKIPWASSKEDGKGFDYGIDLGVEHSMNLSNETTIDLRNEPAISLSEGFGNDLSVEPMLTLSFKHPDLDSPDKDRSIKPTISLLNGGLGNDLNVEPMLTLRLDPSAQDLEEDSWGEPTAITLSKGFGDDLNVETMLTLRFSPSLHDLVKEDQDHVTMNLSEDFDLSTKSTLALRLEQPPPLDVEDDQNDHVTSLSEGFDLSTESVFALRLEPPPLNVEEDQNDHVTSLSENSNLSTEFVLHASRLELAPHFDVEAEDRDDHVISLSEGSNSNIEHALHALKLELLPPLDVETEDQDEHITSLIEGFDLSTGHALQSLRLEVLPPLKMEVEDQDDHVTSSSEGSELSTKHALHALNLELQPRLNVEEDGSDNSLNHVESSMDDLSNNVAIDLVVNHDLGIDNECVVIITVVACSH
ncbi:unnamed protein product [Sphagnum troendelagicum]